MKLTLHFQVSFGISSLGLMYGSQRSLQSVGLVADGIGTSQQQQPPRPMSTSPPPYTDHCSLIDSDIYGRIGMTRHVQVGGTLPAGFGRHQRGYSSLPPSRRQSFVPQTTEQQQKDELHLQQQQQQALSRRSSVASYTTGMDSRGFRRPAASNPSTPEKVLDKKEKSGKKEKDKDKEKKKKEAKTEKSPKKKWFWTLPLRRKKKNKDESTEDDDGGFKAASEKGARKLVPRDDSSFIRYPSPDTASSDMNSSYSSEMSGEQSYRSSPSAEVYYYSRRAQHQAVQLQQQQVGGGVGPRSLPTTPVSPPDSTQSSFVSVNPSPQSVMSDVTDLTVTDLTRGRRYMSREELYAAMRHPQYYNSHRGTTTGPAGEFGSQKTTPTSSRSTSPAVFGVNPLPPYAIRPQVQSVYGGWPPDQQINLQQTGIPHTDLPTHEHSLTDSQSEDISPTTDVDPPEGYQDLSYDSLGKFEPQTKQSSIKPLSTQDTQENQQSQQTQQSLLLQQTQQNQQSQQASQSTPKQTTLGDFKKMILNKSMSSAGGNQRISAVEMLKASRPGIYGYSPPPAPVVKPPQPSPSQTRGEGVIIPPSSRNTARALLFQSRFGSGRRFRTPKTEIISTTILEDHGGEVIEEEDEEEEEDDSSAESPERHSLQNVRGPLARAYSEPCSSNRTSSYSPSSSPVEHDEVTHSTPNTTLDQPPLPPDVSIITPDTVQDLESSSAIKDNETEEKESVETAL